MIIIVVIIVVIIIDIIIIVIVIIVYWLSSLATMYRLTFHVVDQWCIQNKTINWLLESGTQSCSSYMPNIVQL